MSPPTVWRDASGPVDAPAILLIHGTMDRSSGMLKLSRRLDAEYHVLRYDRRGYGRSTASSEAWNHDYSMAAQVDDALDVLDGRRALIVGHSYGGNVALSLAAHHPGVVRSVVVYETPLSWQPWWPGTTAGAQAVQANTDTADAAERFMRRLIGDTRWEALPEGTRETRRGEGPAMVGELTDLRANAPWTADAVTVPVIAGFGSLGAAHHRQGMEYVADAIAGARVVELAGCRHDAPMSHPELFREQLIEPLLRLPDDADRSR